MVTPRRQWEPGGVPGPARKRNEHDGLSRSLWHEHGHRGPIPRTDRARLHRAAAETGWTRADLPLRHTVDRFDRGKQSLVLTHDDFDQLWRVWWRPAPTAPWRVTHDDPYPRTMSILEGSQ